MQSDADLSAGGDVIVPDAPQFEESAPLGLSQGHFKSDIRLGNLIKRRTRDEIKRGLQLRGVESTPEKWGLDVSQKVAAYSHLRNSYLPLEETIEFTAKVLERVRMGVLARNFHNPRYREDYYRTIEILAGGRLSPTPNVMESLPGGLFTVVGPSQTGRTAFLRRLHSMLGKPFAVNSQPPAPYEMYVIPCLVVTIPLSESVGDLLKDLRWEILAATKKPVTHRRALAAVQAENLNAAVAACIAFNVCSIVVDGGSYSTTSLSVMHIIRNLVELQRRTAIPVILTGTPAFMFRCSMFGSLSSNLLSGASLILTAIAPTNPSRLKKKEPGGEGIWFSQNDFFWKCGLFADIPMPEELPLWTYEFAAGHVGWLASGFEHLHILLAKHPGLLNQGALKKEHVERCFRRALALSMGAIDAVRKSVEEPDIVSDAEFAAYADYFSFEFINTDRSRSRIASAAGRRAEGK